MTAMRGALDEREAAMLPVWLGEEARALLVRPEADLPGAVRLAGRLLRSDHLEPGFGGRLRDWLSTAPGSGILAALTEAAASDLAECESLLSPASAHEPGWAWRLIEVRDDVESLLWALGLARSPAEPALLQRAEALDRAAGPLLGAYTRDLWRAPGTEARSWLIPLSRSSEPCWWLNPLVVGRIREAAVGWLTRPLAGAAIRVLPVPLRAADPEVISRFAGLSAKELEARLGPAAGSPVALPFGGSVRVLAVGLTEVDPELPPAFVVVSATPDLRLLSVSLDPPGPEPVVLLPDGRYVVPLIGLSGKHELVLEAEDEAGRRTEHLAARPPQGG